MIPPFQKTNDTVVPDDVKKTEEPAGDDACRCKETSRMTPRELLRLMMRDLAFWNKEKKNRTRRS